MTDELMNAPQAVQSLPREQAAKRNLQGWIASGLGLMMFLSPAIGVPNEYMLQDTLKSICVSIFAIVLLLWFLYKRSPDGVLKWHGLLLFPVCVFVYALGSMAWASNTYLAGVEAVRWFIFAILVWLGFQAFKRDNFDELARWIHAGAVACCVWGLLQFWFDLKLFPQGYAPASTFVNRNFAAEFVVAVFPLSLYTLLRTTSPASVAVVSYTLALNLVFVLTCATRSALVGLLLSMIPLVSGLWLFREKLAWQQWDTTTRRASVGVFVFALLTLGFVPSKIDTEEFYKSNAFTRTLDRTDSFANLSTDPSVGMRKSMMSITFRMIADNPLLGVGGGNWEVAEPRYMDSGRTLEVDYYLHNEFVQHVAEYGVLGLISVLALNALLALAAWRTWRMRNEQAMREEGLLRVAMLCSLFALFIVSCAGFPWRLASTCALFAIGLGVMGASELRLGWTGMAGKNLPEQCSSRAILIARSVAWLSLGLAVWISVQAARCEYYLVQATKLALGVTYSARDPRAPQWLETKQAVREYLNKGMEINPHYRKIITMAADEMARWGDWRDAVEIWESTLSSRPYVTALMLHSAKGRAKLGEYDAALVLLERARKQDPRSVTARSVEVYILDSLNKHEEAAKLARQALDEKTVDIDLTQNAYRLGLLLKDDRLALDALEYRLQMTPWAAVGIHIKAAEIHDRAGNTQAALKRYREALSLSGPKMKAELYKAMPEYYADKLRDVK